MNKIAHRGLKEKFVNENTILAFDNALYNSFDGIEFDVRVTLDNKYIICHDFFIDRVSNGSGIIKLLKLDDIMKYNFGSKKYPSKVLLLEDVIKKYRNTLKIIDLKDYINIKKLKYIDKCIFMSFNRKIIDKIKKDKPSVKCGIFLLNNNNIDKLNYDYIGILDILMNKSIENIANSKDIKILLYGINNSIKYKSNNKNIYYILDKNIDY